MKSNYTININIIRNLSLFILIITSQSTFCQIFDFEQSPPSVKWRQINTSQFRIIYPATFADNAQKVANLLDTNIRSVNHSISTNPRKISIILHNHGVESNGFVQLAPRRSEFLTTPPQHSDPIDWLHTLPIHEYRHVVQMDKLTGGVRPPFELAGMAFFGIALPPWFYEGDAVAIETLLTPAGRGRLPSWEMPLRTNVLTGKRYSYAKNYLGSLKDITPGYYPLGYFMSTKLRREYGPEIMNDILTRIAKNPLRLYSFSNALKHYTTFNTKHWHDQTIADLQKKWEAQTDNTKPEDYPILPLTDSSKQADFLLPQLVSEDTLVALRQTPLSVNSIVLISPHGIQKEIIKTGMQTDPNFSYSNSKITWDEIRYDKRFHKRTFNVVNVYDLAKKRYQQLTHKSRLFSPVLSPDASKIAAIEIDLSNQVYLIILDAQNGKEMIRIPSPGNALLQTPSFHPSGGKIISTSITQEGASIIEFTIADKSTKILLPATYQQIERPVYAGRFIVFKAHYNGIDNLYRLHTTTKEISQISNVPFGAFNPFYDSASATVWFNNYQSYGYQISRLKVNGEHFPSTRDIMNTFIDYFKPLQAQENPVMKPDSATQKLFATAPYKDLNHLFNFHSVSLGSDDFHSIGDLKLGALLLSDNLLNTLSMRFGVAYDQKIHRAEYTASLSYRRYFPILNIDFQNSGRLSGVKLKPNDTGLSPVRWRENVVNVNMEVPLLYNRLNHVYQTGLIAGTSYTRRYNMDRPEIKNRFIETLEFPLHYGFYFNRNSRRSLQDLAPRWGQNITVNVHHFPFGGQTDSKAFAIRSSFYFPGLLKNHSLRAQFNFQDHTGNFLYTNTIPMVNGYDQLGASQPKNTLLLDYRFPIAYPDWSIGPLIYVRRVKGGIFSHHEDVGYQHNYRPRTMGVEVRTDINVLRFFLPVFDVGGKAIYVNQPGNKKWLWQFALSYSY